MRMRVQKKEWVFDKVAETYLNICYVQNAEPYAIFTYVDKDKLIFDKFGGIHLQLSMEWASFIYWLCRYSLWY